MFSTFTNTFNLFFQIANMYKWKSIYCSVQRLSELDSWVKLKEQALEAVSEFKYSIGIWELSCASIEWNSLHRQQITTVI